MPLRAALYEAAWVNMGSMHGAFELCWYDAACRYAALLAVGTSPQTEPSFLAARGFRQGRSLPFARSSQRLEWRPDTLADIEASFATVVASIESGEHEAAT